MVRIFNVDDFSGQRHVTCNGLFIDADGDFAKRHGHCVILRQLEAQLLMRFLLQRSEEHTSELQSQSNLVCRLLLEKKKTYKDTVHEYPGLRVVVDEASRRDALRGTRRFVGTAPHDVAPALPRSRRVG